MSLSICFLTRNEPVAIARAISSVKAVADQIIVGDMGSTDETPRAASAAGGAAGPAGWGGDVPAGRRECGGGNRRAGEVDGRLLGRATRAACPLHRRLDSLDERERADAS